MRDSPPPQLESSCHNCPLKATCYNDPSKREINCTKGHCLFLYYFSANPWHPNRCQPLTAFDPTSIGKHPLCHNASIILWGDSRIRILFGGLVGKIYADEDVVYE